MEHKEPISAPACYIVQHSLTNQIAYQAIGGIGRRLQKLCYGLSTDNRLSVEMAYQAPGIV